MIVGNLDTKFPSVGPNPPISLREREQRRGERRHCGSRQCSKKRSVQYQIEVEARQWLPFTRSFTHGLHTALSNASFFYFPLLCSLLPLFLSLTSAFLPLITEGWRIMKSLLTQAVLGPGVKNRSSPFLVSTSTFLIIFSTFYQLHPLLYIFYLFFKY